MSPIINTLSELVVTDEDVFTYLLTQDEETLCRWYSILKDGRFPENFPFTGDRTYSYYIYLIVTPRKLAHYQMVVHKGYTEEEFEEWWKLNEKFW